MCIRDSADAKQMAYPPAAKCRVNFRMGRIEQGCGMSLCPEFRSVNGIVDTELGRIDPRGARPDEDIAQALVGAPPQLDVEQGLPKRLRTGEAFERALQRRCRFGRLPLRGLQLGKLLVTHGPGWRLLQQCFQLGDSALALPRRCSRSS